MFRNCPEKSLLNSARSDRKLLPVFLLFLFFASLPSLLAQTDTAKKKTVSKEARKATLLSAILPGAGQAYNHKYWKIPVLYAALGGIGYFAMVNNQQYQDYHNELLFRYAHTNPPATNDPLMAGYSNDQLITLKKNSDKYRDICFIGLGLIYVLNIADANVDAHLRRFDVSDDLSLGIRPQILYCRQASNGIATGLTCTLYFK